MVSIPSNGYLRFLHQVHRARVKGRLTDLEPLCARLLDEIALEDGNATPLTVTGLMGQAHIASPATLHRKMQLLLAEGLIDLQVDPDNKRSKFVVLSKKGLRYYTLMSSLMTEVALPS
jgi:DNA-binding MarR family transcriptional regulator